MLLKFFYQIEEERTLQNSLYEESVILIPKVDKDTILKRERIIEQYF
jgi:hypothetical protein